MFTFNFFKNLIRQTDANSYNEDDTHSYIVKTLLSITFKKCQIYPIAVRQCSQLAYEWKATSFFIFQDLRLYLEVPNEIPADYYMNDVIAARLMVDKHLSENMNVGIQKYLGYYIFRYRSTGTLILRRADASLSWPTWM